MEFKHEHHENQLLALNNVTITKHLYPLAQLLLLVAPLPRAPGRARPFLFPPSFSLWSWSSAVSIPWDHCHCPSLPTQTHSAIEATLQSVIFFLIFNQSVSRKNRI